jgi:predicted ATPase
MIRRITRITNAGLFRAWRPDSNMPEFERVNVLYGANGSGKSTLARLFQSASAPGAHPIDLELTVDDRAAARGR